MASGRPTGCSFKDLICKSYTYVLCVCLDSNILHDIAQSRSQSNVQMLKFLTGYPCCHALLLTESSVEGNDATPLKLAKRNQVK